MALTATEHAAVVARDGGVCARCPAAAGADVHHRKARGMGGTRDPRSSDPRNVVTLCRACHDGIESNRTKALATGWLLRSYDDLDEPLVALDGRRIHLAADGGRRDEATTDPHLLGSLADAIDKALAARRAALTQKETS